MSGVEQMRAHSVDEHLEVFRRGTVELIDEGELRQRLERRLAEGRGLRIKFGMDPSSPDLHVGHAVVLRKLRDLQELGHTVILLVGDATAMVGDPSGRNKLRPQLSRADVQRNLETYVEQARIVLDMERAELRHNSEWFNRMSFEELLGLTARMTVAQILQRDTFQKRLADEEPIGVHEFLYPLMQGWDSVELECDVEFGGTDQLFNLMVGRTLQAQVGQPAQIVVTTPLLEGLDGRKMSKSYGNTIQLTDPPGEVFGKTMSLPDDKMDVWFELLTRLDRGQIRELLGGHPREAKVRLGRELVAFLHDEQAAQSANEAFDRQFVKGELPDDIPERVYDAEWPDQGVPLTILLREIGLASSSSEARRLITQGGVKIDGEVQKDPKTLLAPPASNYLLQVGKRKFARVKSA